MSDVTSSSEKSRFDTDWQLYDGVLSKRVIAFCIDYVLILMLLLPAAFVVALLGLVTFGAGWLLFLFLGPAVALIYFGWTLGGPRQASPGMRVTGIRLERQDGGRIDWLLGIVHTVLFWAGNAILTPLILLAPLFLDKKRTVHDLLLGTVMVRDHISDEKNG